MTASNDTIKDADNRAIITAEKLEKYWAITEKALSMASLAVDDSTTEKTAQADDFLRMARDYLSDSKHFANNNDRVNAFGAVNYAHAWLDAGARIGLFRVKDSSLFTVDED